MRGRRANHRGMEVDLLGLGGAATPPGLLFRGVLSFKPVLV